MLRLIALCHYHLYAAFYIMDHCDLLLSQADANDPRGGFEDFDIFCDGCLEDHPT